MNINPITNSLSMSPVKLDERQETAKSSDASFNQMLNNAIKDVNTQQVEGYKAMEDIATGKATNLQEAIQQIEEAELSLKLALEVKNKVVSSTKQLLQMQI